MSELSADYRALERRLRAHEEALDFAVYNSRLKLEDWAKPPALRIEVQSLITESIERIHAKLEGKSP